MSKLHDEIRAAINRSSAENGSDTPDFILAEYLLGCLAAYDKAVTAREKWHVREPRPSTIQLDTPVGLSNRRAQRRRKGGAMSTEDASRRSLTRLVRRFVRWKWFGCFLREYEWYRRYYGGKWMRTHVDFPMCSTLWLPVPDHATPDYREPLWRGTPDFVDYDKPNQKLNDGDAVRCSES